ncbi:MAG TPA: DUF4402 domain-containing protein [Gemmatimonadales bacterium]|nr:DUF4402 domain-containing protein [Gemmatimonadales bacterium]
MKTLSLTLTAGLLVVALSAPAVSAQQSASILAQATVQTPLTVTGVNNLDFGNVFPGVNSTVLLADAGAGHFQITGVLNAEIDVSFSSLPATLVNGGNSMPISYTGGWNTAANPGTATAFTPATGLIERLDAATGELHVYLGGTLTVAGNQPAGLYQATITLDAAYTGN